jgi:hypothetical protein
MPSPQPTAPSWRPVQHNFVTINTHNSPIPSIGPSESYRDLGVDLNTTLTFTKHLHKEVNRTTTSLINVLSTSLLTISGRIRIIRGLFIGTHFTLKLGIFSDSHFDILEG